MRIVGVSGGPNRNGSSATLMRRVLDGASSVGATCEEIHLIDFDIKYCNGCMTCMRTGQCVIVDDFLSLKEKLANCDGIILATPTYGMSQSARMKNFITDRLGMYSVYTSEFRKKYFVGIATAGAIGAKKTAKMLANTYAVGFWDKAYVTGVMGVSTSKGFHDYHVEQQPDKLIKAFNLGIRLANDIKTSKTYPLQNLLENLMMRYIVSNVARKNITTNKDSTLKAVYDKLIESGDL